MWHGTAATGVCSTTVSSPPATFGEARPAAPVSLVSVRTPQDELTVLCRCTIADSRVVPPSSICLHHHAITSGYPIVTIT